MTPNKAYQQYQENSIKTSSPEELTLMLYNGLVKFLMQAKTAIEEKDMEKTHKYLTKAQDIIDEFVCKLDMNYEISDNLLRLYEFMNWFIIQENIKKDSSHLEPVITIARDLRDTWAEAMKIAKQQGKGSIKKAVDE